MTTYKLTCRATGKSYVGITTTRLGKRLTNHRQAAKSAGMKGRYVLAAAIREFGWESFDVEVLSTSATTYAELCEQERAAIVLYGTMHPRGYNQLGGGGGGFHSRYHDTHHPAWNRGIPMPPEVRAKVAASHSGARNHRARAVMFLGSRYDCVEDAAKAHGLDRSQVASRIAKGWGEYLTPGVRVAPYRRTAAPVSAETRAKMSDAHSGAKHYRARRILVDGVEYPSIKDAEGVSGYTRQQLKLKLRRGSATYLSESRYIAAPKEA